MLVLRAADAALRALATPGLILPSNCLRCQRKKQNKKQITTTTNQK